MAARGNTKDRNLLKGLVMMLALASASLYVGLRVFDNDLLRLVGAVTTLYGTLRLALALHTRVLKRPVDLQSLGSWAIVTGCTGGLGEEFARRLAKRGFNLLLISRSERKLEALAGDLREAYSVQCAVLVFDFSSRSLAEEDVFYTRTLPECVAATPIGGDVGVLVNNVGVGDEAPFMVEELKTEDVNGMIKVNCGAIVNMSRAILPLFRHRRKGAVINVSSGSCAQPSPYLATYASSKAFDAHFSKSCAREYGEFGVHVCCVRPYYISGTGLYQNPRPALNAPAAKTIVEGAFASVGRYEVTHAYWVHSIMGWIFGAVMEDPLVGPLIAAPAKRARLNGTMLMIQKHARSRSMKKNAELWAGVEQRTAERLEVFFGKKKN